MSSAIMSTSLSPPMNCIIQLDVLEGCDLPVMDHRTELTDAYVEIEFKDQNWKTDTVRKTLNPVWKHRVKIEVDDLMSLYDEPVELRVWDRDVVSKDDIIGVVYLDLVSLLMPSKKSPRKLSGWFPIFDTLRGIRGQLRVRLKILFPTVSPTMSGISKEIPPSRNAIGGSTTAPDSGQTESAQSSNSNGGSSDSRGLSSSSTAADDEDASLNMAPTDVSLKTSSSSVPVAVPGEKEEVVQMAGAKGHSDGGRSHEDSEPVNERARPTKSSSLTSTLPDSAMSVYFFAMSYPDAYFRIKHVHGFVEELVVEDDPEFHWKDSFRAHRQSNESRQMLLYHLSGRLKRQIGKKVKAMGANAVLSYKQTIDVEGEVSGVICARAIGTACTITKRRSKRSAKGHGKTSLRTQPPSRATSPRSPSLLSAPTPTLPQPTSITSLAASSSAAGTPGVPIPYSSSSEGIKALAASVSPSKSSGMTQLPPVKKQIRAPLQTVFGGSDTVLPSFETTRVTFLTLSHVSTKLTAGMECRFGGMVLSRCVKVVKASSSKNLKRRDRWWQEVRQEVRTHARRLGCNIVFGYRETLSMYEDEGVCILTGVGTAASLSDISSQCKPQSLQQKFNSVSSRSEDATFTGDAVKSDKNLISQALNKPSMPKSSSSSKASSKKSSKKRTERTAKTDCSNGGDGGSAPPSSSSSFKKEKGSACSPCLVFHCPISILKAGPCPTLVQPCAVCGMMGVPELMLSTMEPPATMSVSHHGGLITAHVVRPRKRPEGREPNANVISEELPFLEFDLHHQLLWKMQLWGYNAVFRIKHQIEIGENFLLGSLTGTGVHLNALPPPPPLALPSASIGMGGRLKPDGTTSPPFPPSSSVSSEPTSPRDSPPFLSNSADACPSASSSSPPLASLPQSMSALSTNPVPNPSGRRRKLSVSVHHNPFPSDFVEVPDLTEETATDIGRRLSLISEMNGARYRKAREMNGRLKKSQTNATEPLIGSNALSSSTSSSPPSSSLESPRNFLESQGLSPATVPSSGASGSLRQSNGADLSPQSITTAKSDRRAFQVDFRRRGPSAEVMAVLLDPALPLGFAACTTNNLPLAKKGQKPFTLQHQQHLSFVSRMQLGSKKKGFNRDLSAFYRHLMTMLYSNLQRNGTLFVSSLDVDFKVIDAPSEQHLQAVVNANVIAVDYSATSPRVMSPRILTTSAPAASASPIAIPIGTSSTPSRAKTKPLSISTSAMSTTLAPPAVSSSLNDNSSMPFTLSKSASADNAPSDARTTSGESYGLNVSSSVGERMFTMDEEDPAQGVPSPPKHQHQPVRSRYAKKPADEVSAPVPDSEESRFGHSKLVSPYVLITTASSIPSVSVERYLSHVCVHFVKERTGGKDISKGSATHTFLKEAMSILRAHVLALGGNALFHYRVDRLLSFDTHRSEAYLLISLSGDAVVLST
eukprot:TRINITY_DN8686_c0_g1_i1.p1 TRINITY_DN8686_c0_g1~~TRINITY_DN8686_c0_g1_i1.p1  ORF type:complete len:1439 (+),score=292.11 TRINITY_DN8686_c0_g1_i1:344-4660(+)